MKAATYKTYGPPEVLTIEEVEKPTPKEDEVLVKVYASSVNPAEWYTMTGLLLARLGNGLLKPKESRLGVDYAGVVEAVASNRPVARPQRASAKQDKHGNNKDDCPDGLRRQQAG